MKQLTPLEEFINWINSDCTPMDCVLKAKELLEKEKQVIVDAVNETYNSVIGIETGYMPTPIDGEDYYNNKYSK